MRFGSQVSGLRSQVLGPSFRVSGPGSWVWVLDFGSQVWRLESQVWDRGFLLSGLGSRESSFGSQVQVSGLDFRVLEFW